MHKVVFNANELMSRNWSLLIFASIAVISFVFVAVKDFGDTVILLYLGVWLW